MNNPARPSALVANLFDAGVACADLREDADSSLLYPAEAAFCTGFATKRMLDFTAGRLCARRALAQVGVTGFPIAVNPDRTPRWPPGTIGSISHTASYCCAVVAKETAFAGIGVDVERVGRVTTDLEPLVFTPAERAFLSSLEQAGRVRAATILFSAKEAFYKCQYGLTHQWLDFTDVSLELTTADLLTGGFAVALTDDRFGGDPAGTPLRGRFCVDEELALTGIALHHEPAAAFAASMMSANADAARSRKMR